jgi:hypothetical protein
MKQDSEQLKARNRSSKVQEQDSELRLWSTHREESVFFQREAQVNLWTVLGGLVMAALLTQLSPLLREIQASRWYLGLYALSSVLILASCWVQTSWGSHVLRWPISIYTTVVNLFSMLVQSIQCLLVTNPAGWLAATGVFIIFALLIQLYFERSGAWKVFPPELLKRFKFTNVIYAGFMLLCLAGAFHLYRYPSRVAEMVWGFVSLFLSILALVLQHKGMQQEKRALGIP